MIEVKSIEQLNQLIEQSGGSDLFILKHSPRCSISFVALEEFTKFSDGNPSLPCVFIDVIAHREVSNALEEKSGVRHHSPQVIQYYDGYHVWNTSHMAITEKSLTGQIHD